LQIKKIKKEGSGMKKLYYLVGSATAIGATLLTGPIGGIIVGGAVLLGPYAINRSQHVVLNSNRGDGMILRDVGIMEEGNALRLLSFNIFMRPSLWFVKNVANDWKNERLEIFIREHLPHFGIICLQEMFATFTWRQHKLLDAAEKCGFQHAAIGGAAPFIISDHHLSLKIPFLDAGVVTLSKYPIIETDALHYSAGVLIDSWAPKICLHSLIRIPVSGQYLHVFNTHMQSTHTGWDTNETIRARAKQMEELAFFIRSKVFLHPAPALICGDFNLDAHSSPLEYERLLSTLKQELDNDNWKVTNLCADFPVTYAMEGERVLTLEKDWDKQMCLDYTFLYAPEGNSSFARPIFFDGDDENFFTLSDHTAMECIILI
jgi:endonuclease/exonuclease/phosphatase family metal-dependent hydrolase